MAASITSLSRTGGLEQDSVTIYGSGFGSSQGSGGVTLNTVLCSTDFWSDGKVICRVAASSNTGQGNQELKITGNDLSTSTDKFWAYELSSLAHNNWDTRHIYQYPLASDSTDDLRTQADARDINRALEHADQVKRAFSDLYSVNQSIPVWNIHQTKFDDYNLSYMVSPETNGFRLSLVSGDPVPSADQVGKTDLYLTPFIGGRIALYDGSA